MSVGANLEGTTLEWLDQLSALEKKSNNRTGAVLATSAEQMLDRLSGLYTKIADKGTGTYEAPVLAARINALSDEVGDLLGPQAKKVIVDGMKGDLQDAQKMGSQSGVDFSKIIEGNDTIKANAKPNMPAIEAAGTRLNDFWAKENTQFRDRVKAMTQMAAAQGMGWNQLSLQVRELLTLEKAQGTESARSKAVNAKLGIKARGELIARTELATAFVLGQMDEYEKKGFKYGRWTATAERSCGFCASRHGQIFTITEMRIAIPAHPRCRCTITPVKTPPGWDEADGDQRKILAARHLDDTYWTKSRKKLIDEWKGLNKGLKNPKTDQMLDDMIRRYAKTPTNTQDYLNPGKPAPDPIWTPSGYVIPDQAQAAGNSEAAAKDLQQKLEKKIKDQEEKAKLEAEQKKLEEEAKKLEEEQKKQEEAKAKKEDSDQLDLVIESESDQDMIIKEWGTYTPEQKKTLLDTAIYDLKEMGQKVVGLDPNAVDQLTTEQKLMMVQKLSKMAHDYVTKNNPEYADMALGAWNENTMLYKTNVYESTKLAQDHKKAVADAEAQKKQLEQELAETMAQYMIAQKVLKPNEAKALLEDWMNIPSAERKKLADDAINEYKSFIKEHANVDESAIDQLTTYELKAKLIDKVDDVTWKWLMQNKPTQYLPEEQTWWNKQSLADKKKILADEQQILDAKKAADAAADTPDEAPLRKRAEELQAELDGFKTQLAEIEAKAADNFTKLAEAQNALLRQRKLVKETETALKDAEVEKATKQVELERLEKAAADSEQRMIDTGKAHQENLDKYGELSKELRVLETQTGGTVKPRGDVDSYNEQLANQQHTLESLIQVGKDVLERAGIKDISELSGSQESRDILKRIDELNREINRGELQIAQYDKDIKKGIKDFQKRLDDYIDFYAKQGKEPPAEQVAKKKQYQEEWLTDARTKIADEQNKLAENKSIKENLQAKLKSLPGDPATLAQKVINELVASSPLTRAEAAELVKALSTPEARQQIKREKLTKPPEIDSMIDAVQMFGSRLSMDAYGKSTYRAHASEKKLMQYDLDKWKVKDSGDSSFGLVNSGSGDSPKFRQTQFHELAHHAEFMQTDVYLVARDFIMRRATSDKPVWLGKGYGKGEVAYRGDAIKPYVLKSYREDIRAYIKKIDFDGSLVKGADADERQWHGYGDATEVISMGVEHLSSPENIVILAGADPEHLLLALGTMRLTQARAADLNGVRRLPHEIDIKGRVDADSVARLRGGDEVSGSDPAVLKKIAELKSQQDALEKVVNKSAEDANLAEIKAMQDKAALDESPLTKEVYELQSKISNLADEVKFQTQMVEGYEKPLKKIQEDQVKLEAERSNLKNIVDAMDPQVKSAIELADMSDIGQMNLAGINNKAGETYLSVIKKMSPDELKVLATDMGLNLGDKTLAELRAYIYSVEGGAGEGAILKQMGLQQTAIALKPSEVLSLFQVPTKTMSKVEATAAPAPAASNPYLEKATLKDLKAMAKDMGLKGFSTMKKPELVELLNSKLGGQPAPKAEVTIKDIKISAPEPVPYVRPQVDFGGDRLIIDGLTLTAGPTLSGSTRPVAYVDADGVTRYVLKKGGIGGDGQNEVEYVSQRIYNIMATGEVRGVNGHLVEMPMIGDRIKKVMVTEWVAGAREIGSLSSAEMKSLDIYRKIRSTHMVDSLLANWDYVGLSMDNMVIGRDGKMYKIDSGGTLNFRAQGSNKEYGPIPHEVFTLREGQGKKAWAKAGEADLKHLWQYQTKQLVDNYRKLKDVIENSNLDESVKQNFKYRALSLEAAYDATSFSKYGGKKVDEWIKEGVLTWRDIDQAMKNSFEQMRSIHPDENWDEIMLAKMEANIQAKIDDGLLRQSQQSGTGLVYGVTPYAEQVQMRGEADHWSGLWGSKTSNDSNKAIRDPQVIENVRLHLEKVTGKAWTTAEVKKALETIYSYTGSTYQDYITAQLRTDKPRAYDALPDYMKDGITGQRAKDLYEKIDQATDVLEALPVYTASEVFRGMKFKSERQRLEHLSIITDGRVAQTISYSTDFNRAEHFDSDTWSVVFHVEKPKTAVSVKGLSQYSNEYEVLYTRNARFKLVKASWNKDGSDPIDLSTINGSGDDNKYKQMHVWFEEILP